MPRKKPAIAQSQRRPQSVRLSAVSRRHAAVLSQVWFNGPISRSDLHERTGTRLRTVGSLVEDLISWGLIEEGPPRSSGVGRPQVPLCIRADSRNVLGVSLTANQIVLVKAGLKGDAMEPPTILPIRIVDDLVPAAAKLVQTHSDARTLAIGVGLTGFVDDVAGEWLLSSAHPAKARVSLKPLIKAAREIPISISNELHAMSAAARLSGRMPAGDSLLIRMEDGRVGASILVSGKPNSGSVMAANELGHTTMPVKVERCYCGKVGCIERIFTTRFLRSRGCSDSLDACLSRKAPLHRDAMLMVDLLCRAIANAVNLVRPANLILCTPLHGHQAFVDEFERALERHTLSILFERLKIEWQMFDPKLNAICASSLPLAAIFEESV